MARRQPVSSTHLPLTYNINDNNIYRLENNIRVYKIKNRFALRRKHRGTTVTYAIVGGVGEGGEHIKWFPKSIYIMGHNLRGKGCIIKSVIRVNIIVYRKQSRLDNLHHRSVQHFPVSENIIFRLVAPFNNTLRIINNSN